MEAREFQKSAEERLKKEVSSKEIRLVEASRAGRTGGSGISKTRDYDKIQEPLKTGEKMTDLLNLSEGAMQQDVKRGDPLQSQMQPPAPGSSPGTTEEKTQSKESKQEGFTKEDWLKILFGLALLAGILLRFNFVLLPMNDEILYTAASMEANRDFDPTKEINAEHPPVAKILMGLACNFALCHKPLLDYVYTTYYPVSVTDADVVREVLPVMEAIRVVPFIFSLLLGLLVYYYAEKEYGKQTAVVLFALTMLSPNFILYSNVVMLDMIMLFFFTATLFFYLFTYRRKRDWTNLAILALLLALSFGTKQYIPLTLLPIIAAIELLEYRQNKTLDRKLLAGAAVSLMVFLTVIYPIPKFLHHLFNFYTPGTSFFSAQLNFDLIAALLARTELPLAVLLGLAAYRVFEEKTIRQEEKYLMLACAVIALGSMKIPAEKSSFRYAITFYPPLLMFCGLGLRGISKNLKIAVAALLLVSAGLVVAHYPYYDDFDGPLGWLIAHKPVERAEYSGVLSFLSKNFAGKSVLTTDYYALPYARGINVTNIGGYVHEKELQNSSNRAYVDFQGKKIAEVASPQFVKSFCGTAKNSMIYMINDGFYAFVYRKQNDVTVLRCRGLDDVTKLVQPAYDDPKFAIYRVR